MSKIGDNIKRRRIELGLSQSELAKKIGYTHYSSVSKVELGQVDLPQSKIMLFAKALETTPVELMGLFEPDEEQKLAEEIVKRIEKLNKNQREALLALLQSWTAAS